MDYVKDLVIDVGMHNGDDTAYYLHKGYRVVAIEANPRLVARGQQRFAGAIGQNRLKILPIGVAAERGTAEFFVAPDLDVLSSFNRAMVERADTAIEKIEVQCLPFRDVLAEHGVPHYLKVDIEGNDRLCVAGLAPPVLPAYVSIEMDPNTGDSDLRSLRELGYTRFQCIRQTDFLAMTAANIDWQLKVRRKAAEAGLSGFMTRVARAAERRLHSRRDGSWHFPSGSTGRFGADLTGSWMTADDMLGVWKNLHDIDIELAAGWRSEWFDVHAALPASGSSRP